MKFEHWRTRVAVVLFDALLLLLIVNLVLYAIMRARRPSIPQAAQTSLNPDSLGPAYPGWRKEDIKILLGEIMRHDEYEYEPFTGFRERPFRGRFLNVDAAGFRFSRDQAPWPPSPKAINVFVFGGSTTFGVGLPDDETIPSYLQEFVAADHSAPPLAVYNFARPAYFSSQELILFQQLLNAGFVPQVAVFIDGVNDFIFADGQPRFTDRLRNFMDGKSESPTLANLPMVQAAHWLKERWIKPKPQPQQKVAHYDDRAFFQGAVDRWLANKRMIEVIAKGFGVRAIFVWQPVPVYKYDIHYHLFVHVYEALWRYVRVRCGAGYPLMENLRAQGKLGPNVLWLADMQQDKRENLYVDSVHYNAAFSKEIAAQIYGYLREPSKDHGSSAPSSDGDHRR